MSPVAKSCNIERETELLKTGGKLERWEEDRVTGQGILERIIC